MPSLGVADAAGDRQRALHLAAQNRQPAQTQEQLAAGRELEAGPRRQVSNVDIRLKKAIEENQAVRARSFEVTRDIRECREVRRKFDRDWNLQFVPDVLDDLTEAILDGQRRLIGFGDHLVYVQFERVGTRLLDEPREIQPCLRCRPVEGTDDRNLHRFLQASKVVEVLVGPERVSLRLREIRHDGRKLAIERIEMVNPTGLRAA